MLTAREAALRTVLIAEQHVIEQEARIDRQRDLILSLSEGGHQSMLRDAHELLAKMEALLAEMNSSLARAEERLYRLIDATEPSPICVPPDPTGTSL
jgi:hypothetical protein